MPDPNDATSQNQRRQLIFSGYVQGVGFRFTTKAVAEAHEVTGFVRNLPDGRVEVMVEGSPSELDRFTEAVKNALRGNIHDCATSQTTATGEFTSFLILH